MDTDLHAAICEAMAAWLRESTSPSGPRWPVARVIDWIEHVDRGGGACETCGPDPAEVIITYLDTNGQRRTWTYCGTVGDFVVQVSRAAKR